MRFGTLLTHDGYRYLWREPIALPNTYRYPQIHVLLIVIGLDTRNFEHTVVPISYRYGYCPRLKKRWAGMLGTTYMEQTKKSPNERPQIRTHRFALEAMDKSAGTGAPTQRHLPEKPDSGVAPPPKRHSSTCTVTPPSSLTAEGAQPQDAVQKQTLHLCGKTKHGSQ